MFYAACFPTWRTVAVTILLNIIPALIQSNIPIDIFIQDAEAPKRIDDYKLLQGWKYSKKVFRTYRGGLKYICIPTYIAYIRDLLYCRSCKRCIFFSSTFGMFWDKIWRYQDLYFFTSKMLIDLSLCIRCIVWEKRHKIDNKCQRTKIVKLYILSVTYCGICLNFNVDLNSTNIDDRNSCNNLWKFKFISCIYLEIRFVKIF